MTAKEDIIELFRKNVKGKIPNVNEKNVRHDGKKGHWLEEQFEISPNADNKADLWGYELKNETVLVKCSSQANIENIELYATCHIQSEIKYQYQEIYLLPYSIIDSDLNLFEIIINHAIKA